RIERLELQHRRLQSATDQRVDLLSDRVADLERVPPTEEDRSPEPGTAAVLGVLGIGALAWLVRRSS
ncbi:MAG: PEP-CTERM sorting domain-containing protein, partial [Actinobacteria bacterium]|nr:PEP-CTERM sorting domain-containing protein [Actinomycetota bacterium]